MKLMTLIEKPAKRSIWVVLLLVLATSPRFAAPSPLQAQYGDFFYSYCTLVDHRDKVAFTSKVFLIDAYTSTHRDWDSQFSDHLKKVFDFLHTSDFDAGDCVQAAAGEARLTSEKKDWKDHYRHEGYDVQDTGWFPHKE